MLAVLLFGGTMSTRHADDVDKVTELANDLDDLKTNVEEMQVDPPPDVDPRTLERVKGALDEARDATDELEDQQEESVAPEPKG
jgi:type VI protein secretion system component VasK